MFSTVLKIEIPHLHSLVYPKMASAQYNSHHFMFQALSWNTVELRKNQNKLTVNQRWIEEKDFWINFQQLKRQYTNSA